MVDGGGTHTLGLKSDGRAYAWGLQTGVQERQKKNVDAAWQRPRLFGPSPLSQLTRRLGCSACWRRCCSAFRANWRLLDVARMSPHFERDRIISEVVANDRIQLSGGAHSFKCADPEPGRATDLG
jgi:Regulator of chromosome condensation (RCC1) repeat